MTQHPTEQLSLHTTTRESVHHKERSRMPQLSPDTVKYINTFKNKNNNPWVRKRITWKIIFVHDAGCLGLVRWEGPGGGYGEVGREEGSGWGACDFFFKNKIKKKKYKQKCVFSECIFNRIIKKKKKKRKPQGPACARYTEQPIWTSVYQGSHHHQSGWLWKPVPTGLCPKHTKKPCHQGTKPCQSWAPWMYLMV